jgi:hypothetical protein
MTSRRTPHVGSDTPQPAADPTFRSPCRASGQSGAICCLRSRIRRREIRHLSNGYLVLDKVISRGSARIVHGLGEADWDARPWRCSTDRLEWPSSRLGVVGPCSSPIPGGCLLREMVAVEGRCPRVHGDVRLDPSVRQRSKSGDACRGYFGGVVQRKDRMLFGHTMIGGIQGAIKAVLHSFAPGA